MTSPLRFSPSPAPRKKTSCRWVVNEGHSAQASPTSAQQPAREESQAPLSWCERRGQEDECLGVLNLVVSGDKFKVIKWEDCDNSHSLVYRDLCSI